MRPNSKSLFGAILVFILLDLSVLAINYWITYQLSKDAVAINLSGRQRMLSQRITKSLLLLQSPLPIEVAHTTKEEFRYSVRVFDQTLLAFERGGITVSGDGGLVTLDPVDSVQSRQPVAQALQIWSPMHERMLPYMATQTDIPDAVIMQARHHMIRDNLEVLDLMNNLTSSLEQESLKRANALRIAQTGVFLLALINFFVIFRKFHVLARQSAQASQHYNELAMQDPLTGLFNRRQFAHNLEKEIAAVDRRQGSNVALVMIDLDEFKAINDKHGHEVGDKVLRAVAARLTESARMNDTVARVGGDEFMLICPDLHNKENAEGFCQRLLGSLKRPVPTEAGPVYVGASIGVAFYPDPADSVDDLIRMADKAMYAAKNTGRNRYIFFAPPPMDSIT